MGRRAENQARPVGSTDQAQPAAVERNTLDPRPRRFEHRPRPAIAGALDPCQIARAENDPRNQFNRRLRRRGDDQPSRVGLDAAVLDEVIE